METVVKIFHDDGTEDSFGPVQIPKNLGAQLIKDLKPLEDKRQEDLLAQRAEQGAAEQERRSAEAEKANRARIKASGAEGVEE